MTDAPVEFDRIVAECLDAIASGQASVEECLERYPALSESLRPLLEVAAGLRQTQQAIRPAPSFSRQAGARLQARLADSARPPVPTPGPGRVGWRPTLPMILVATALLVVMGGGVLVNLANRAVPGDSLYGLDQALERLSLALADEEGDVELQVRMAEERLDEAQRLTEQGRVAEAETALEAYQVIVDTLEAGSRVPAEALEHLEAQREQLPGEEPGGETPVQAAPDTPEAGPTPAETPEDADAPPAEDTEDTEDAAGPDAPGQSEDAAGNPRSSDAPGNWQDAPGQSEDRPTGPGNNNAGGNSGDADDTGNGNGSDKGNPGAGQSNNSDPPANNGNSSNPSEAADVSDQSNPGDNNSNNQNSNAGGQGNGNSGQSDDGRGNSGNKGGGKDKDD